MLLSVFSNVFKISVYKENTNLAIYWADRVYDSGNLSFCNNSFLKNAKDLQKEIEESMDTVLSVYTQRQKKKTFRFRGETVTLLLDQIMYIESKAHQLFFICAMIPVDVWENGHLMKCREN